MASATLDPSAPLHNTFGAMLIGVIASAVLHGITLLQAFLYFQKFRKDGWLLKSMVITTVSFDAIHLFFITHSMYYYLVANYHDHEKLRFVVWSILMEALLTGVNAGIVQSFYAYRIWRLSKGKILLTGSILALILATTACGTAWVIITMQLETYKQLLNVNPLTISINALSTTVDIAIAASLCILLHNARTGFRKSDTIINKLIVFVVNTGVLTTCCAVASLICLVASPDSLLYATFYFCIGRFYTNSFLATLNARRSLTANVDESGHMMNSIPASAVSPHDTHSGSVSKNISIRVDTVRDSPVSPTPVPLRPTKGSPHGASTGSLANGSDGVSVDHPEDSVRRF